MKVKYLDKGLKSLILTLFVGVVTMTVVSLGFFVFYSGFDRRSIEWILGCLIAVFMFLTLFLIWSGLSFYFIYKKDKNSVLTLLPAKYGIKFFFAILVWISGLLGMKKDLLRKTLIMINNKIVNLEGAKYDQKDILIIVPHCMQYHDCSCKLINGVELCTGCGKCSIKGIRDISREFGVKTMVVTGGTAARNAVKKIRPKFILAVACERDLASGIMDVGTIPVVGIVNDRPNGPCFDTFANIEEIRKNIQKIIKK